MCRCRLFKHAKGDLWHLHGLNQRKKYCIIIMVCLLWKRSRLKHTFHLGVPCNTVIFHYLLYFRRGQHTVPWSSSQIPSTQITINAPARIWRQAQKVLRLAFRQQPRPPNITLKFILGPAALTVTARLLGTIAHCEADVNNNIPEVQAKEKIPEFSWSILWEFVRPQLLALIGAIIVSKQFIY